jgi:hypothetical protein
VYCVMTCRSCGSNHQAEYGAEINIHLPRDQNKAAVLVFPSYLSAWIVALRSSLFPKLSCACWGNVTRHLLLRNSSFISGEDARRPERQSTAADKLPALSHRFQRN